MEILIEILGEIFFEGIIEIIKNKNISKWIRYPLLMAIVLFYIVILAFLILIDIRLFKSENILVGLLIFIFIFIFLVLAINFILNLGTNKKRCKQKKTRLKFY